MAAETGIVFRNNFVEVCYKDQLALVTIRWKRQISFEERKTGYQAAFNLIKETGAVNLLINNEEIFLFTNQEKLWISETLYKWKAETHIRKFALVTTALFHNLDDLVEFIQKIKNTFGKLSDFWYEFFVDQETALTWLQEG